MQTEAERARAEMVRVERRRRLRRTMLDRIAIADEVLHGADDRQTVQLAAMGSRATARLVLRQLDRGKGV